MNAIEMKDLTKIYKHDFISVEYGRLKLRIKHRTTVALEGLDLEVKEGEIFGLLGPNGAGKTTAIKILMGIHFATRGKALIMGKPLGDKSVKAQIGFLPENPYFYDYLTGDEFLNFYGMLYGMNKAARKKKIPEVTKLVNIDYARELPLKGYSKGMLQRIGMAQVLLNDPKLVLLDEPQSGLDPLGRKEIRDIMLNLRDNGKTVFFSSHILSDAELICDRVAILYKGRLKAIGNLKDLLSTRVKDFELTASGLSAELSDKIAKISQKVVRSEDDIMFIIEKEQDASGAMQEIIQSGARLLSYVSKKETLEEYFLRQVGGKE